MVHASLLTHALSFFIHSLAVNVHNQFDNGQSAIQKSDTVSVSMSENESVPVSSVIRESVIVS